MVKLVRQEDMPWGVDSNGRTVQFDLVMARMTLGQYDELRQAMLRVGLVTADNIDLGCEATLYDGKTGVVIERAVGSGSGVVPVRASYRIA